MVQLRNNRRECISSTCSCCHNDTDSTISIATTTIFKGFNSSTVTVTSTLPPSKIVRKKRRKNMTKAERMNQYGNNKK